MNIINIRYNWPLFPASPLVREDGSKEYVFLNLRCPCRVKLANSISNVPSSAIVVIAPGTPYSVFAETKITYDWMHVVGEVPSIMQIYGLAPNEVFPVSPCAGRNITRLFEEREFYFYCTPYFWWKFCSIKLEECFMTVSRDIGHKRYANESDDLYSKLQVIRSEMSAYPERDWSAEMLSALLHVSPSRVYPLYKKVFNTTPHNDLILMRVEQAKRLLNSDAPISQIASDCGYRNFNHFCRQFKLITQLTPSQFRDLQR